MRVCVQQGQFLELKKKLITHEREALDNERRHGLSVLNQKQGELNLAHAEHAVQKRRLVHSLAVVDKCAP